MQIWVLAELADVDDEDDVVVVSILTLLVEAGYDLPEIVLSGGVGDGSDAKLGCGVPEERSILRHHHLLGPVDALVLDIVQVPMREDRREVPEEVKRFDGARGVVY